MTSSLSCLSSYTQKNRRDDNEPKIERLKTIVASDKDEDDDDDNSGSDDDDEDASDDDGHGGKKDDIRPRKKMPTRVSLFLMNF